MAPNHSLRRVKGERMLRQRKNGRSYDEWLQLLSEIGALWKHDGNPKRPHALLTKGGHSDGFFHGKTLFFDRCQLGSELCYDFVQLKIEGELLFHGITTINKEDRVLGPQYGVGTLIGFMAASLGCGCAFTIPVGEGESKQFRLEDRFQGDLEDRFILPMEDVITTGDSIMKTIEIAENEGGAVAPIILAICNRSGQTEIGGRSIVAMFDIPMTNWSVSECPLCRQGSEAIRPKKPAENWSRLTAAMAQ